jgi:hypothetical protein
VGPEATSGPALPRSIVQETWNQTVYDGRACLGAIRQTLPECQLAVRHRLRRALGSQAATIFVTLTYRSALHDTSSRRSRRGFKTALEVFVEV